MASALQPRRPKNVALASKSRQIAHGGRHTRKPLLWTVGKRRRIGAKKRKERARAHGRNRRTQRERESWRAGETERRESKRAGGPSERVRKRKPQLTRAAAFILAAGAGGSCRSAVRSRAMQPCPLPSQEAMQLRPHLEEREGRDRERGRGRRRKSGELRRRWSLERIGDLGAER